MSTMVVGTPALLAVADARVVRLVAHFAARGDPRTPPADWRPTYPMDDPRNEPDLWIADLTEPVLWCKADTHRNQTAPGAPCSWCGSAHRDAMTVYTYMLPSDY